MLLTMSVFVWKANRGWREKFVTLPVFQNTFIMVTDQTSYTLQAISILPCHNKNTIFLTKKKKYDVKITSVTAELLITVYTWLVVRSS